tara:strand:+ start:1141 stop:1626 length:486 start_codon:yes stop_codon:yes gene_type:complete
MTNTPTYISLLNAISVTETSAGEIFENWADSVTDKKLEKTLRLIEMREKEHGIAFAKRMLELGYEVRPDGSDPLEELRKIASSNRSELSKLKALKYNKAPASPDIFDGMFSDKTIDPVTGGLLGRYIAEERDTGKLLRSECQRLQDKEKKAKERLKAKAAK